jgi:SRSO17 transposase
MDEAEFARVAASFATFHAQFAPLFGHKDAQAHSEQYVRGLLVQQTDRRNAENVAEVLSGVSARALQRFLTDAPWATEPVIARLQAFLGPRLSTPEGIWIIDESGVAKQGQHSVGWPTNTAGARASWPTDRRFLRGCISHRGAGGTSGPPCTKAAEH